jgi:hypothetical protein
VRRSLAARLAAGVLSVALVRAASQTPAQVSQPQPVFRVGVDAVRIDAVVTDKNGHIVTDLNANDFELRQDGRSSRSRSRGSFLSRPRAINRPYRQLRRRASRRHRRLP